MWLSAAASLCVMLRFGGNPMHKRWIAIKTRFSHLTLHERAALYAYLKARAEKAQ